MSDEDANERAERLDRKAAAERRDWREAKWGWQPIETAEVRAALLEEGINVDQLPLLTDMRPPEGQERN
jgi:hypothetical protein